MKKDEVKCEQARNLRREGKAITEIARLLACSKSSAQGWTKDMPVPEGLRENGYKLRVQRRKEGLSKVVEYIPKVKLSGHTKSIGEASQLVILSRLVIVGYVPLLPYGENLRYDLALDVKGKLCRIQCKTGRLKQGAIRFPASSTQKSGRRFYTSDEIDFFGIYCPELDKCYLIPFDKVGQKREYAMRVDPVRNGQTKNIRWAKEFEL